MCDSIKETIWDCGIGCDVCGELAFKTTDYQCTQCRKFFCGDHLYMSGMYKACITAAIEVKK